MPTGGLIELSRETIDGLFTLHNHQHEIWKKLYEIALPDWQCIEKVEGYPRVSENTNKYLFDKFIEFDQKYHPEVLAGGCWMNSGFSGYRTEDVPDWMIDLSKVHITYKPCYQYKEGG